MTQAMSRPTIRRAAAISFALALLVGACGGSSKKTDTGVAGGTAGVNGGTIAYGLEAETTGGFCLAEAQLAFSGIQVARTLYDTLAAPNAKGEYKPYLAKSITPNATFDDWTITLRDGVKFHDGTALDATVVKNNLDAYRGKYTQHRHPALFVFVFLNIKDVTVVDKLTVKVTTNTPWPALPAYLFGSGRIGIMAQAQLDDDKTCGTNMIGTGPFKLKEWVTNDHLSAVKNPNYWQKDSAGNALPYLDSIEYRPIPDPDQRLNALQSGQIQAMATDNAETIGKLRDLSNAKTVEVLESDKFAETNYWMLNTSKDPFDNLDARLAVAYAFDAKKYNTLQENGIPTIANGPFGPGNVGNLADTGFPTFDLTKAKEHAAKYKQATGKDLAFSVKSTTSQSTINANQIFAQMMKDAGISVSLSQTDQAQLINLALKGDYNALDWRNHPGGDPDTQYVWWHSGSPVNFGKLKDAPLDKLLGEGRVALDADARKTIYENVSRQFAKQAYNIWKSWDLWVIGTAPNVKGIMGPGLPDGGGDAWTSLSTGHPVLGMYLAK